jgi:hypothetical protein
MSPKQVFSEKNNFDFSACEKANGFWNYAKINLKSFVEWGGGV